MNARDMSAGSGGPVGVTIDGRAAPAGAGTFETFRYGWAPAGLATRRQLAARGLRPNGQEPIARLSWRRGRRVAYLYAINAAAPKRRPTPAQLVALESAMRARRTCPTCRRDAGYCIPLRFGACLDCHDTREEAA